MPSNPKRSRERHPETDGAELRRHRVRVLFSLVGICRNIERLQASPLARRACKEVAALLDGALTREIMSGRKQPRSLGKR